MVMVVLPCQIESQDPFLCRHKHRTIMFVRPSWNPFHIRLPPPVIVLCARVHFFIFHEIIDVRLSFYRQTQAWFVGRLLHNNICIPLNIRNLYIYSSDQSSMSLIQLTIFHTAFRLSKTLSFVPSPVNYAKITSTCTPYEPNLAFRLLTKSSVKHLH